ncbi:TIGR00282 family metallophosphoesterase [Candidatus Babeliales bacterium]|nr:TIGR00282 family metallophosphoesterase [Candidatus Babeliales bacterium]
MAQLLRFIFIGDVVGTPGISVFQKWVPKLKEQYNLDAVFVNGENSAKNGNGITPKTIQALKGAGATIITTGNHAFDSKDVYNAFNERDDVIRPANYPSTCPGKGYALATINGQTIAVINIHGRVFVNELVDCPFRAVESLIEFLKHKTKIIFVDFHGEATSEKVTMGYYLDGKVSGVYGTHTHVQTADDRILPGGTSYITDLGFSGSLNSVIGMQYKSILNRFLIQHRFGKFQVESSSPLLLSGIFVEVDADTGKAVRFERIRIIDKDLIVESEPENDKK